MGGAGGAGDAGKGGQKVQVGRGPAGETLASIYTHTKREREREREREIERERERERERRERDRERERERERGLQKRGFYTYMRDAIQALFRLYSGVVKATLRLY